MAAKNLDELINHLVTQGPLSTVRARLRTDLKDFIAHEIQKLELEQDHTVTAQQLFNRIFKGDV